jgi:hypothetical protein
MRAHHTKSKGDLGVLHAQVDLAEKGYGVLLPLTEHEAFDLVAYKEHTFYRVQVKYRRAVNGLLGVALKSNWSDRRGVHVIPVDKASIDVLCIYSPDTNACYYVDPSRLACAVYLRISDTKNRQRKRVLWARDFVEFPKSVRGISAGSAPPLVT